MYQTGSVPQVKSRLPSGRVLVVCTGNVCRSPLMQGLLRARLTGTGLEVASAGTGATPGSPPDPRLARLIDPSGDEPWLGARQVTQRLLDDADLVLCAERANRSYVVQLVPGSLRYTFTLAEFSDLAVAINAGWSEQSTKELTDSTLREWLVSTAARHRSQVAPRRGESADVVDPYRRSERVFDQMMAQVHQLLPPIADLLIRAASVGGTNA